MRMTKQKFIELATSWKFKWYLFTKLPAAWFVGLKVKSLSAEKADVSLPFRWSSKNPFSSIYFAAQTAAAELSTGVLVLYHIQEQPPISMLVKKVEGDFGKKATQTLTFTCDMGAEMEQLVKTLAAQVDGKEIRLKSVGRLPDGVIASEFWFTWTLKVK
jgi:hypothetical protein